MKAEKVKVLVITGLGLSCEKETAKGFELAGATPTIMHLNDLIADKKQMEKFHILAFVGGTAFGDQLGAGMIFANRVELNLRSELDKFIKDGKLIIGIGSGFHAIVRLGLAPAFGKKYNKQQVALAPNDSATFLDDWCNLKVNAKSPCVFTRGIDRITLPVRHSEGKFIADDDMLAKLEKSNQVVIRYVNKNGTKAAKFPSNPNGSMNSIAAICDETGRVFGILPTPEAFLSPYNSPSWTADKLDAKLPGEGAGVAIFRNAVNYVADNFKK